MNKPMARINSVLEYWASLTPPVIDFTVENILRAVNYETTYDYILRFLNSKDGFELTSARIYLCQNNHKAYHCELDEEIDEDILPLCHICGEEIIADLDHSFVVFNFSEEFIEDSKKKVHRMKCSSGL